MTIRSETREIGIQYGRAQIQPDTVDREKRTVEVTWTTGARVMRGYYQRFFEELSLDPAHVRLGRMNNGAPFLADHAPGANRTHGVVQTGSAKLLKKEGRATLRFLKAGVDPESDKLFERVADAIVQNVSVGYAIHRLEKIEETSDGIPVYRATDWEPLEISAVSIGADDGAGFRSADPKQSNPCVFLTREGVTEVKPDPTNPVPAPAPAAAPPPETRAVPVPADPPVADVIAERARVTGILSAAREAERASSGFDGSAMAEDLISKGTDLKAARSLFLTALAASSEAVRTESHVTIEVGETDRQKFQTGMRAWVIEAAGLQRMFEDAAKRSPKEFGKLELDGAQFRGASASDIARMCLDRAGVKHRDIYSKERLFDLALRSGGLQTGGEFVVLFEDVLRKSMRASYQTQEHTWRRWCGTDSVQDFKAANRYMNGTFGYLPVVAESAPYTNLKIPDGSKLQISTETRGAIIAISRQALINDDMGALTDVAVRFGATAGRTIEKAAYDMLLDNAGLGPSMADAQPYFHSNRSNVATGAALSGANLDKDRLKMRKQKDAQSVEFLNLEPRILLVPTVLETAARSINTDTFDHDSTKLQKKNMQQNMFADIISHPRLDDTSATRRYLFTAEKEAFKVVFLSGSGEGPRMESKEGFRVDGTEWKASLDFKVNPYDPKTALVNDGT